MKRALLLASVMMCVISCNNKGVQEPINAYWFIGSAGYKSTTAVTRQTVFVSELELQAYDDNGNGIQVFFASQPTTGNYTIVNEQNAGLGILGPNECAISENIGNDIYLSTGAGGNKASVAVNNLKADVSFPYIPMIHVGTSDTIQGGAGYVTEK
jgi:hypothetical protein